MFEWIAPSTVVTIIILTALFGLALIRVISTKVHLAASIMITALNMIVLFT